MDWASAARFLGALVDLIILEKQLDILEMAVDAAYDLADREVKLAEKVIEVHCELLAKTVDYYAIANSAPEYEQKYECAMSISNTDVKREANRFMNNQLDSTDMYSTGLRRDIIETGMAAIMYSSSATWGLSFRSEDNLADKTNLIRLKHRVDSINAQSLFTGHETMRKLANDSLELARSTSALIENHFEGFVTGITDWAFGPSSDRSGNAKVLKDVQTQGDVATPLPSQPSLKIEPVTDRTPGDRATRLPESQSIRVEPVSTGES